MDKIIKELKPYYPEIIEISRDNIKDISFKNIVAFTYALSGAQGDNGAIYIVHKSDSICFYHINRLIAEDEKLIQMVDGICFNNLQDVMNEISIDNLEWARLSMGQGNLLFIKSKFLKDFAKLSDQYLNRLALYKKGIIQAKIFPYPLRFQMLNLFFCEYVKN